MDEFIKKLGKKFGEFTFVEDDGGDNEVEIISTGALSLDVSTGVGGIPKGKITTIYGAESSGKTTLCLEIVKNAIKSGEHVFYLDVEQTLDFNYIKAIVGDFDSTNLIIAQPEYAEDALQMAEIGIHGDEKLGIAEGRFGLIIVDSIGALAPRKEKEKELTDSNVALIPRLMSAFLRRNAFGIRKHNIAFIFVNQVRDNIGSYMGGYTLPGGHALKHYSSLILFLSKSQEIKAGDEVIGINSKFIVKKNKLAPPFRSFTVPIMFGDGIDYYRDVVDFTATMGVLKRRGAFYVLDGEIIGQGLVKSALYLQEHKEALDKVVKLCYDGLSKSKEFVEEELDEQVIDD